MSVLRKGGTRRTAIGAAVTLGVFQALAIVGAMPASAVVVGDCTYNPSNDTVTVLLENGDAATIAVVDPGDEIQITASNSGASDCGSATTANTVAIVALGSGANISDETFTIDNSVDGTFAGIAFSIDMGAGTGDEVEIIGSDGVDTVVATNDTFSYNGGTGELVGTEFVVAFLGDGNDVFDGSGATSFGFEIHGQAGDDTLTGGGGADDLDGGPDEDTLTGGNGNDDITGGPDADFVDEGTAANGADSLNGGCTFCVGPDDGDELSYAGRTNAVDVSLNASAADADDGEGCVNETPPAGCEGDDAWNFSVVAGGAGNDILDGDESNAFDEELIGNAGDDVYEGNGDSGVAGAGDIASWRDSAGPITVDSAAGTATGDAVTNDSWTEMEGVKGSASSDDLLNFANETGPINADLCDNGDNVSGATSFFFVAGTDLNTVNCTSTFEHMTGSPGNDILMGDIQRNVLDGGDGNDVLSGFNGNDTLIGRAGNDTYTGGAGADTASFKFAPNGVTVDVSLGFASGEGDDTLGAFGDIEIVVGSDFADDITGGLSTGGGTVNFRFKGRGGADTLTGSASNDTLQGGGGPDTLRAGPGEDTLKGNKGRDTLVGGPGFDIGHGGKGNDTCRGVEQRRSC